MKNVTLVILLGVASVHVTSGQGGLPIDNQRKALARLIDQYSMARENKDTILLKTILTEDVDQLVSTGEWRNGMRASVKGMLNSSATAPGTRTLTVEKIKLLGPATAIVDCKYDIQNPDGSMRRMWSSFVAVSEKGKWKISAIRNMLPGR